jgi:hypothetical protein
MIKIFLVLLALIFPIASSYADCGYMDDFHINPQAPTQTKILGLNFSGKINAYTNGNNRFIIKDTSMEVDGACIIDMSPQGRVAINIGTDPNNSCNLTISDGPFVSDPLVEANNCKGNLHYTGITYDGFRSHTYTLHFSG